MSVQLNFRDLEFEDASPADVEHSYWFCDVNGGYSKGGYRLEIRNNPYVNGRRWEESFSWGIDTGDVYIEGFPTDLKTFEDVHEDMMKFLDVNGLAVHSIGMNTELKG